MAANSLKGARVLVTGGNGFLGRRVLAHLAAHEPAEVVAPRRAEYDLRERGATEACLSDISPEVVIHLAAVVGGIGANRENPGLFFYENAIMGIELMEQARRHGVAKFVQIGTVCSYPKFAEAPFREDAIWAGYPEETNAPYGLAKKMLLVQAQAYRQQYGFNAVYLIPVNLYGPEDNFDLETGHVIPALVRKFVEARVRGELAAPAWGTGQVSREFLYVDDAARGIAMAADTYDGMEPVNLGTGRETTIRELTQTIADLCGYEGEVVWDGSKPDGQPRRMLDTSRAKELFGFEAKVSLEEGLRRTIDWYSSTRNLVAEGAHL